LVKRLKSQPYSVCFARVSMEQFLISRDHLHSGIDWDVLYKLS